MSNLYTLIWIGVTLILIGFFAGIEIAFVSANRLNIELKKQQGRFSGIILSKFVGEPAKFLGTSLIGLNICLVIYGLLLSELMKQSLWNPFSIQNQYIKLVFDTLVSTFIVLILGEFLPKAIFRARNDSLLSGLAPLMNVFYKLLYPIASVFVNLSQGILEFLFNVRIKNKNEAYTTVDLEYFFQQTKEQEEGNQELNAELFENALSLPNVKVRQFLVPRTEIEGADIQTPIEEIKKQFIETKLSKLVVYDDSIDNVLGYVHQLDLFKKPADIRSILLPIPPVPESMSAMDLISKFSKERKSIAWVVDEFGGTSGIVTMEDVLEEIFGEIRDEYDTEEFVEKQIAEDEFIFSGRLELDYLNEKFDFDFPENESETLSGYIINQHEAIPKSKERIIIDRFEFNILNVSDTRIDMVKMKVLH
ncbi:MAG: HlyC/CorC family transporter [Chitinophagaceae bacterium]|nr:HlyC/CorC family transporter [Chitinophagaceae bacterium]